jgi:hypothetical protein
MNGLLCGKTTFSLRQKNKTKKNHPFIFGLLRVPITVAEFFSG